LGIRPGSIVGVVGGPGDQRDEDLIELSALSAKFFDHIVVKEDDDGRSHACGDVAELIVQGIQATDPAASYSILLNESEVIE
jgi:cyanophycin synthetase